MLNRPDHATISLRASAAALALVWGFGCGVGGSTPTSGPPLVFESEPNDQPQVANFVDWVQPGQSYVIEGSMGWSGDNYDGFAFVADEPCEVEFVLSIHDNDTGLAVCLYDPYWDEVVYCFSSGTNPQLGGFAIHAWDAEFHLVVMPLWGAADYTLSVNVFPPIYGSEAAPAPGEAGLRFRVRAPDSADPNLAEPTPEVLRRARGYSLSERDALPAESAEFRPVKLGDLVTIEPDGTAAARSVWTDLSELEP